MEINHETVPSNGFTVFEYYFYLDSDPLMHPKYKDTKLGTWKRSFWYNTATKKLFFFDQTTDTCWTPVPQ